MLDESFLVLIYLMIHLNRLLYEKFNVSQLTKLGVSFPF